MPQLNTVTLGKFCRELACGLSERPVLLAEWKLTEEQYAVLEQSPGFKREMMLVLDEMKELGADAGYIYRMKSLAEDQIAEVVKIMQDPATGVGTRVDLIKFVADMARVKEKPALKGQDFGPRGPQVIFQFGAGLPVQSMTLVGAGEGEVAPERAVSGPMDGGNPRAPWTPVLASSPVPTGRTGAFGLPLEVFE